MRVVRSLDLWFPGSEKGGADLSAQTQALTTRCYNSSDEECTVEKQDQYESKRCTAEEDEEREVNAKIESALLMK